MKELTKLPDKWYIKGSDDLIQLFKDIKISNGLQGNSERCGYYTKNNDITNWNYNYLENLSSHKEITVKDFRRLILKEYKFKVGDKVKAKCLNIESTDGYIFTHTFPSGIIDKIYEDTFHFKDDGDIWFYEKDFELVIKNYKNDQMDTNTELKDNTTINIGHDLLMTYYKASTDDQKAYLNKHFSIDGTTTIDAIKGLYEIACDTWRPKIKANHPDIFKEDKVWKREVINKEGKDYFYINRNMRIGFDVGKNLNNETNLNYTFSNKEEAENEALLYSTIMLMRNWARFHNKLDNFVPDWQTSQIKYGIFKKGNRIDTDSVMNNNWFLFQLSVSSKERAEEMLNEFKDDIQKLIDLKLI